MRNRTTRRSLAGVVFLTLGIGTGCALLSAVIGGVKIGDPDRVPLGGDWSTSETVRAELMELRGAEIEYRVVMSESSWVSGHDLYVEDLRLGGKVEEVAIVGVGFPWRMAEGRVWKWRVKGKLSENEVFFMGSFLPVKPQPNQRGEVYWSEKHDEGIVRTSVGPLV